MTHIRPLLANLLGLQSNRDDVGAFVFSEATRQSPWTNGTRFPFRARDSLAFYGWTSTRILSASHQEPSLSSPSIWTCTSAEYLLLKKPRPMLLSRTILRDAYKRLLKRFFFLLLTLSCEQTTSYPRFCRDIHIYIARSTGISGLLRCRPRMTVSCCSIVGKSLRR